MKQPPTSVGGCFISATATTDMIFMTWNRKLGARTELCVRCGLHAPASQRRRCKACLAEMEADRRARRMESDAEAKPCYMPDCQALRFRLPSQYSSYCYEHHQIARRKIRLMADYGLSIEEYDVLMERADHRCEICGSSLRLRVDHCHATGIIRGVLCDPHNTALGSFGDNTDHLLAAVGYLLAFQERVARSQDPIPVEIG